MVEPEIEQPTERLEQLTALEERRREQLRRLAANRNRARRMTQQQQPRFEWWRAGSLLITLAAAFALIGGQAGLTGAIAGAILGASAPLILLGLVLLFTFPWGREHHAEPKS